MFAKTLKIAILACALSLPFHAHAGLADEDLFLVDELCHGWGNVQCRAKLDRCYDAYRHKSVRWHDDITACVRGRFGWGTGY